MFEGLSFGWRTALLLTAVLPLLPISAGLFGTMRNRTANRTLAALLMVLAGLIVPYIIGFAGFYDRWQWIQFISFSNELAAMPLLYLYLHALVTGHWPQKGWWHLAPAIADAIIRAIIPAIASMNEAAAHMFADLSDYASGALLLIGGIAYAIASYRLLRNYRNALADRRSDDARFANNWLSRTLAAMALMLTVAVPYKVIVSIYDVDYFGEMTLYVVIACFALFMGIEGWRNAALPFPTLDSLAPDSTAEERDWRKLGKKWADTARSEGWVLQSDLTLAQLARKLGTNTSYLSRGLNEGLGVNFSTFVNGLRSEIVAEKLRAGSNENLLDLALDAGFASKPTFNRAFHARFGKSPAEYRAAHVSNLE